ncbi:MAG: hypothetical protein AAB884_00030 [Patescibacteria group bacterium]
MRIFVGKGVYPHDERSFYWSREECFIGVIECEDIETLARNAMAQLNFFIFACGHHDMSERNIDFSVVQEKENPRYLFPRKYFPLSEEEKEKFWEEFHKLTKRPRN